MKKYPAYKDSGIEWIGNIPEHWEIVRMKYLCDIGTGDKDTENAEDHGEYPFFVRSQTIEKISSYTFDGEAILTAGDGVGVCKVWHHIIGKFDYHQRVYRMSDFNGVIGRYLYYYLKQNFVLEVKKLSAKSTVDSLRRPMFQNFQIAIGTLEEQTTIAAYLDHKTAEIDTLIKKKKQLIALYKEERTATINAAVTGKLDVKGKMSETRLSADEAGIKGLKENTDLGAKTKSAQSLNPNNPCFRKMKDSGVDWIGEIPEHWGVKPLRYLGYCQNGVSAGADYFGSGFPFVSYSDVYKNEVLPFLVDGLAKSSENEREQYSIVEGDVLFTRTSETVEEIAIASTCMKTIENSTFAGFLIRFRAHKNILIPNFSKYFFGSTIHRTFFIKEMNIVTRASLPQGLLKRLSVILPPHEEQVSIAEWLDIKLFELDDHVSKTEQEIKLLKEYKTALISEVVLGKVDVREEKRGITDLMD